MKIYPDGVKSTLCPQISLNTFTTVLANLILGMGGSFPQLSPGGKPGNDALSYLGVAPHSMGRDTISSVQSSASKGNAVTQETICPKLDQDCSFLSSLLS